MPTALVANRLSSHLIASPAKPTPAEAVAWLGAMQAQDYNAALWAVGLRTQDATLNSVSAALAARTFLRTWLLRGTLHVVAAADIHWMLALVAPRLIAGNARRYSQLELDEATLTRSNALLSRALQDSTQLTRHELLAHLEQQGISTQGQRGYYMLVHAALSGLICQTTAERSNSTFHALPPAPPELAVTDRETLLAALAQRYFSSHGPATLHDFVWWSGLTMGEARTGLELAKTTLLGETIGKQTYWQSAQNGDHDHALPAACLLPAFDEYLLGYSERNAILDPENAPRVSPGGNGVFYPMVVIDGRIVGTWKASRKKHQLEITASPFTPFSAAETHACQQAAARYSAFLEAGDLPLWQEA